ncbi:nuclear transport factor 2 family protein [Poseidonocella sp. HB161398]|uniref:nuclear transport factor 2 family protein n=1 Tax=Poseidonocella sp. HB161398 TaxID=2320855 RepID=UPI00110A07F8|nr:nuclear transport factor 2 family protein [Poseidonocella sp. HB161398]
MTAETIARPLTAADKIEIQELISEYSYHEDTGNAAAWGALFTEDGQFCGRNKPPVIGRGNLVAFAERRWRDKPQVHNRAHWVSNILIRATPEGAAAQSYQMSIDRDGADFKIADLTGKEDELRQENGRWRFHLRRVVELNR